MTQNDDLLDLLEARDQLLEADGLLDLEQSLDQIEDDQIRALGEIVLETSCDEMAVFSTT